MPLTNTWARPPRILWGLFLFLVCFPLITSAGLSGENSSCEPDSLKGKSPPGSPGGTSSPSPLTWPVTAAISLYQKVLSPQQGRVCAFQPTCSNFAQESLRKYGLLQGTLMTSDRLARCHRCATGHYSLTKSGRAHDPVKDHLLYRKDRFPSLELSGINPPFSEKLTGDSNTLLAFANHLASQGDYRGAGQQFLAFSASSPQNPGSGWASLRAGICFQKMSRWPDATSLFTNLSSPKTDLSLAREATFQLGLTRYLSGEPIGNFPAAANLQTSSHQDRAALLNSWAHLCRGEWSLATSALARVSPSAPEQFSGTARIMREKATCGSHLPQRSPALAALFSAIVPGSGKWYAGRPTDGFYSLLLVGTNIAIACAYGQDDQWAKAGLFGTVGFFFHLGNIYGSAVQAERFNHGRRQAFLHDLSESTHPQRWLWDLGEDTRPQDETITTEKTLALAEDLFQVGRYDRAITEYKRHLFFFPQDPRREQAEYKIGLAYLNLSNWEEARAHLRIIHSVEAAEELQYRSRLRWAQSFLSQDLPERGKWALRELLSKGLVVKREDRGAEVQYWMGVCALRQGDWVEAVGVFHGLEGRSPETTLRHPAQQLSRAAREGYHLPHRSPTLATALSVIIPGSGQVYCGRWWDGLFSLALNTSVGYLTVEAFHDGRRLDGMLLASLLWARFYFGGQQNAARHAREYNRMVREEHFKTYRELMTPEYKE